MNTSTASNHKKRAKDAILSVESTAAICKQTRAEIHTRQLAVKATIQHCPVWVRAYLDGIIDLLQEQRYSHLEFCYILPSGKIVSTHRKSSRYFENEGVTVSELSDLECNHYWKGTDKPYGTSH